MPFFKKSIELAKKQDLKLKIFDAFRPTEAQWKLWEHTPNENFIANPKKGSPHSRGVAIDLTLINKNNYELDKKIKDNLHDYEYECFFQKAKYKVYLKSISSKNEKRKS